MSAIAVLVQLQPHLPDCAHQGMFNQCIGINPPQQELGSRSNPLQVTLQPGRNLLHRLAFGRVTELDMQSFSLKTWPSVWGSGPLWAQICRFPQYATQTVLSCPCHAHVAACVGTANLLSMNHKYITPHLTSYGVVWLPRLLLRFAAFAGPFCRTQILQSRNSSAAEPHQKLEKCTRNCIVSGFNDIHPLSYLYICIYNLCIYIYICANHHHHLIIVMFFHIDITVML